MNDLKPLVPLTDVVSFGNVILGKGEVRHIAGESGPGGNIETIGELLEHHCHNQGPHKHLIRFVMLEGDRLWVPISFSALLIIQEGSCCFSLYGIYIRFLKGPCLVDLVDIIGSFLSVSCCNILWLLISTIAIIISFWLISVWKLLLLVWLSLIFIKARGKISHKIIKLLLYT